MKHRFYIPELKISSNIFEISDKNVVHQITKVLRLKNGDTFNVFSPQKELSLKIIEVTTNFVRAEKIKEISSLKENNTNVTLFQSLLKKDNFELVIQKVTELGVNKIIPIITEHTIIREISKNKNERYQKIIQEATEQSGGIISPDFGGLMDYCDAIKSLKNKEGVKMIAWEGENKSKISNFIKNKKEKYHIFIGPEGGFTPAEIELAINNKIIPISLGNKILRSETASISAVSLILLSE